MRLYAATIDPATEQRLREDLAGIANGMERACAAAVNRTLVTGRSRTAKRLAEIINLPKGGAANPAPNTISSFIGLKKASHGGASGVASLGGEMFIVRRGMDAMLFRPRQTKVGVSIKVNRGKGVERWRSAFVAKMKNGKQGVFERARLGVAADLPPSLAAEAKKTNRLYGRVTSGRIRQFVRVGDDGRAGRLPLVKRYGPTPVGVFVHAPGVAQDVVATMDDALSKNLLSQVDRLLGRAKADRPDDLSE